jgi:hypothetical protein
MKWTLARKREYIRKVTNWIVGGYQMEIRDRVIYSEYRDWDFVFSYIENDIHSSIWFRYSPVIRALRHLEETVWRKNGKSVANV